MRLSIALLEEEMTEIAPCALVVWQLLQRRGVADCRSVLAGAH